MAALTSNTGTVLERYRYDDYGQRTITAADGTTVRPASLHGNQYGFTGRYLDKETGLWYFRARYYSASLGRFVSRDPWGYVDGWNLYLAYFVPNALDATGLVVNSVEPNTDVGAPWSYKDFNAYGSTSWWIKKVECSCKRCDCQTEGDNPEKKGYMSCEIKLRWHMYLNTMFKTNQNPSPGVTFSGTYGHEQKHVRSILAEVKKLEKEIEVIEGQYACKGLKEDCDTAATAWSTTFTAQLVGIVSKEAAHSNEGSPGKHDDVPPNGPVPPEAPSDPLAKPSP